MARKTVAQGLLLLFSLFARTPLGGQDSPLRWPVPPPPRATEPPQTLVSAAELTRRLTAGVIPLDARGNGAYVAGHLPGAVPAWSAADESPLDPARLRALLAMRGIEGDRPVVLYGDPDREAVARLFWLLRWAGCAEVQVLEGGLAAWRRAGGGLEKGPSRRHPAGAFRGSSSTSSVGAAVADADEVDRSFGEAGTELLDVRDARGWERWETPPTFAAGHIPYSLPFDPRTWLPGDGGWPDPAELGRRLGALGPRPADPVPLASTFILYGEDGRDPRLGLGYLLLTLAGVEARVFPGGWRAWTAGERRPIVRVVSAAELAARLERENPGLRADLQPRGLILIDLREAQDFRIGHLPGALSLPLLRFAAELDQRVAAGWPGVDRATTPLVLYCYGSDCVRSRKAGARAARLGFSNVLWFRGGVREWRQAGDPLLDVPGAEPASPSPSAGPVSPSYGAAHP
jgi:thiosulfate/3-mercaptopyruvate sulfurtransferase